MSKLLILRKKNQADLDFFSVKFDEIQFLPISKIKMREISAEILSDLTNSEWIFFTSGKCVAEILQFHDGQKIATIGHQTAKLVKKLGFHVDFISNISQKLEMCREFDEKFPEHGQIFYPKSNLADDLPLKNAVSWTVYDNLPSNLTVLSQLTAFDAVYFSSPSNWSRFLQTLPEVDKKLQLIAIGQTTAKAIEKSGFQPILKKDLL